MHKVSCYLIVRATRRRSTITGAKIVASRATRPSLAADEATIKITLDVPDELFDPEAVALVVDPREAVLAVEQEQAAA